MRGIVAIVPTISGQFLPSCFVSVEDYERLLNDLLSVSRGDICLPGMGQEKWMDFCNGTSPKYLS
ncbi:MAG: hypothetical protein ACTS7E_02120 [Arsenophonus sp. NC-CH8-MAG3]